MTDASVTSAPSTAAPLFDPKKPHGIIQVGAGADEERRFFQNGHYFRANHSYHSSDKSAKKLAAPVTKTPDTLPAVKPDEEAELLLHPAAEELMDLPRDAIIKLVMAANGPVISGEGSTKTMVAWLIKNTKSQDQL